jgi:hypothetical protein
MEATTRAALGAVPLGGLAMVAAARAHQRQLVPLAGSSPSSATPPVVCTNLACAVSLDAYERATIALAEKYAAERPGARGDVLPANSPWVIKPSSLRISALSWPHS